MSVAGHHVPIWFDEATGPDDGDVSVWNSATGRFESAPVVGGAIPDGTYDEIAAAVTLTGPKKFTGGKPWWDAETLAELQSAITAATAAGGGTVRVAVELALGSTAVSFPDGVSLLCVGKGVMTYTGTGSAVTFDGQNNTDRSVIRVRRTSIGWNTADATSVGVTLRNCLWGEYHIHEVQNFETGLLLFGDSSGTSLNDFRLGRINDNKRGIRVATAGGALGYANQNTFRSGVVRISNFGGTAGSRYLDLGTANGNTFLGVNLEGSAPEKVVVIGGVDNMFLNCRMESNAASSWHFLSTSARNFVIGAQGLLGPFDAKFLDESSPKQNVVIGGRGMEVGSDATNAAFTSRALNSNSDASYSGRNTAGQVVSKILGGGQFEGLAGGETLARVKTDMTGGPGGYGGIFFGRGNVAPAVALGVSANGFGLKTDHVLGLKTSTTGARPSAVSAGAGAEMYDTTLSKPIYSDGTVWRDAAGTAV